jgi:hypothetical protein
MAARPPASASGEWRVGQAFVSVIVLTQSPVLVWVMNLSHTGFTAARNDSWSG